MKNFVLTLIISQVMAGFATAQQIMSQKIDRAYNGREILLVNSITQSTYKASSKDLEADGYRYLGYIDCSSNTLATNKPVVNHFRSKEQCELAERKITSLARAKQPVVITIDKNIVVSVSKVPADQTLQIQYVDPYHILMDDGSVTQLSKQDPNILGLGSLYSVNYWGYIDCAKSILRVLIDKNYRSALNKTYEDYSFDSKVACEKSVSVISANSNSYSPVVVSLGSKRVLSIRTEN